MTRVLHILPHPGGGGEVYVSTLESIPGFKHARVYLSAGRTPRAAALSVPGRLPELIRKARAADVLHIHGDASAIITSPLLLTKPTVVTTHGLHLFRRSRGPITQAVGLALRGAVAASSAVIATSESERAELGSVVRQSDRGKLRVIFNGVPAPARLARGEREEIRATLGIEGDSVLGIFVGQLETRKEPMLAAASAVRVHDSGVPFVLAFVGDGPLLSSLQTQPQNAIRVLGALDDVQPLLAAADVFVQSSSREGMSLALLEAMSHGIAIIAADSPGNVEAVGNAGLIFPAGDHAALTDGLVRLASDSELRARFGNDAKTRAARQFGLDRFLSETASVYSLAVEGSDKKMVRRAR